MLILAVCLEVSADMRLNQPVNERLSITHFIIVSIYHEHVSINMFSAFNNVTTTTHGCPLIMCGYICACVSSEGTE